MAGTLTLLVEEAISIMPELETRSLTLGYGDKRVVQDVTLVFEPNSITSIIGPSGCGKSTLIRQFNRMNEVMSEDFRVFAGQVFVAGYDISDVSVDTTLLRRQVGMVFQKPNPFPGSIFDNVAYGPRIHGERRRDVLEETVEQALQRAHLWDEVKNRLDETAAGLSGGQQQRLCIARAIAVQPRVLLMDEPCSALDPVATAAVEQLIEEELVNDMTVVIVTHNIAQAKRISQYVIFLDYDKEIGCGVVREVNTAIGMFFKGPKDERTLAYIKGHFG